MTTTADLIKQLIEQQTDRIKTLDIGIISKVINYNRVNVKLKHTVSNSVVEYTDVLVLPALIGASKIYSYPVEGDTVVIGFFKHESSKQLEHKGEITKINELTRYTKPVVLTSIDTNDSGPQTTVSAGETIILHNTGSYIKFAADGGIEISAPTATLNGANIKTED